MGITNFLKDAAKKLKEQQEKANDPKLLKKKLEAEKLKSKIEEVQAKRRKSKTSSFSIGYGDEKK